MSKIVVLGARGFIGKHLVKRLAANRHDTIVSFDRPIKEDEISAKPEKIDNVAYIEGDFHNKDDLRNVLKDADYVFHLVTATTPATSNNDPLIDIDLNIRRSVELFELCVEYGVKKIVFPSSGGTIYGNTKTDVIDELTVPQPQSPYGIGKLTVEHYLRYFKALHGIDYVIYRIANPYGPGQNIHGKQGVIPIFMSSLMEGSQIKVFGDGTMVRDYIYISDLINMMVETFKLNGNFSEYNVGSGSGSSINEIIENIENCSGLRFNKTFLDAPSSFVNKSVLSIERFNNEFGIKPVVDLNSGIRRTWEYVQETIKQ